MELAGWNQLFPEYPTFAPPAIETGDRGAGSGSLTGPYIPPVLLKSIAWLESGWAQGSYDPLVQYGQIGPVLSSHDCGYGIMQVTSGMQNVSGVPTLDQAMIGGHYAFNIARGARILAEKWNAAPEYRPIVGARNPTVVEDWYYALWGYNGFAFKNHPLNPDYAWPRPAYDCGSARSYPYQELVLGCAQTPPTRGGSQLWNSQPVTLPNLSDPAFYDHLKLDNWNPCSYNLQCAAMDIPTPNPAHQDPSGTGLNRAQVLGNPSIIVSTSGVSLVAAPGGQSPNQQIAIGNGGSGVLAWRLPPTAPWLRLSRIQGVSLGADLGYTHQIFAVSADASSLLPGTHTAQIKVESLYAAGSPATINVTLQTSDGALVSTPDGRVYVLVGGLRRYIPDGVTFESFGFKWSSIMPVPSAWLNAIPAGQDVPSTLADGRLIRSPNGQVYVMQSGGKRYVISGDVMASCGYGWDSIAVLPAATADRITTGPQLAGQPCPQPTFPNGTLLQGSDGRVWVTIGKARKWITGGQALSECGYQWGNRNGLGDSIMNSFAVFPPVAGCTSDGSLLWRQDGSLHVVYGGLLRHIPNGATFEANGFDWSRITPQGAMALPVGDPLLDALADGRLLSAGGPVYVMDSGSKRWISGSGVFTNCAYDWGAIGIVSPGTLASLPEGPPLQSSPCPRLTLANGTLLAGTDGSIWVTLGLGRKWVTSLWAVSDCGFNIGNVNLVSNGLLAGFGAAGFVHACTAEGSLVATPDGRVSVVRQGWRRWAPSGATLEAGGLSWEALVPIADGRLPEGRPLPDVLATGRLIQSPTRPVYAMQSGVKRWITGGDVMSACGYGWDAVTRLSDATVIPIPDAAPLSSPPCPAPSFDDGTLLSGSDGRIWAVKSGQRRWITGGPAFSACGYNPANVDRMPDSIIAALPMGPNLGSPPCP